MKKIIRLTESDLARIVKRVIREGMQEEDPLEGHISVYHEYKNGKISKDLFYRFIGVLDRRDKERLLDYIKSEKENQEESLNESFYEDQKLQMFIDMLDLMIDNYDDIDCDNPSEKYERMYCENMSDWSINDLKRKRDSFSEKLQGSSFMELYRNSPFR